MVGGAVSLRFWRNMGSFLNSPTVRYIGKISYGIYVYHTFANFLAHKPLQALNIAYPESVWLSFPMEVGISITCAAVSWRVLEQPLDAFKQHFN